MTAQTKGRIRHVALSVEDPWETAEFYKQAVGLQEVTELDGPLAEGVFLTDGVVNLAILHFKSDEAAQGTGKDFVGIHHIGFWVDDVVEQGKIARNAGATWIMGDPNNPDGYEVKHTDLNGIIFDIAAHGWAGSQKNPGSVARFDYLEAERGTALEQAAEGLAVARVGAQVEISALEEQQIELEQAVADAAKGAEVRSDERARGQAKLKRVEIALRAAHDAARIAAGPNAKFAPPEHAQAIQRLESERDERARELQPLVAAHEAAESTARQARNAFREVRRRLDAVRGRQTAATRRGEAEVAKRSAGAGAATRERIDAYAAVGRHVIALSPGRLDEGGTGRHRGCQHERPSMGGKQELELFSAARLAADSEVERRGWILLACAGGAVLVLVVMVLRIALRWAPRAGRRCARRRVGRRDLRPLS